MMELHQTPASTQRPTDFKPWVVVTSPGQGDESIVFECSKATDAYAFMKDCKQFTSLMKRLIDGTLTTEF